MKADSYLKNIANEFGGMRKEILEEKLRRLLTLSEIEKKSIQTRVIEHKFCAKEADKPKTIVARPPRTRTILDPYDKALNVIRAFNNQGWKHITEIPVEIFREFWNISEMHREIIFDSNRDYQYFKVVNFSMNVSKLDEGEL